MNAIQVGDVVKRAGDVDHGTGYGIQIGDVIEKDGERCQVAWRERQVPNFYRPEEMVIRKGKRTWVRQNGLARVS